MKPAKLKEMLVVISEMEMTEEEALEELKSMHRTLMGITRGAKPWEVMQVYDIRMFAAAYARAVEVILRAHGIGDLAEAEPGNGCGENARRTSEFLCTECSENHRCADYSRCKRR